MLEITPTGQFRKDFKLCKKRGYDMSLLKQVIDSLAVPEALPEKTKIINLMSKIPLTDQ